MKGDFSRLGFQSGKHFSQVLYQRGRLTLDADSNEASAIVLHHLRTLTRDLYGAAGGPPDSGFRMQLDAAAVPARLLLGPGHYYVGGILCENESWTDYAVQPDVPPMRPGAAASGDLLLAWLARPALHQAFLVYLEVWERHITWIEDDSILEPALIGADTCTRAKVVWQVKALPWDRVRWGDPHDKQAACCEPLSTLVTSGTGRLTARVDVAPFAGGAIPAAAAGYGGAEDRLYNVEVHRGGRAGAEGGATFKWSRANGSVAARWLGTGAGERAPTLIVSAAHRFRADDWVELSHDALDLTGQPGQLVRLAGVHGDALTIDVQSDPGRSPMAWSPTMSNPKVRRWDHYSGHAPAADDGAIPIVESDGPAPTWLALEHGIQVAFASGGHYRTGDHWTIPARTADRGILWPPGDGPDAWQPTHGNVRYVAPLGVLVFDDATGLQVAQDCRRCLGLTPTD